MLSKHKKTVCFPNSIIIIIMCIINSNHENFQCDYSMKQCNCVISQCVSIKTACNREVDIITVCFQNIEVDNVCFLNSTMAHCLKVYCV